MSQDALEKRMNDLDIQMVHLLNERTRVALEMGERKGISSEETYMPEWDMSGVLEALSASEGPLTEESLRAVYREVMSAVLSLRGGPVIGYLGPAATFTHLASRAKFGASVTYEAHETISDVFTAVQKGKADYGVVPIENSTDGAVTHTLDQCMETPLKICAEIYLPISQCLMANIPKEEVKRIYSKGEVFGQCRSWLNRNMSGVELIPVSSTARAAEMLEGANDAAALASSVAAELYGLDVLAEDIQDMGENTTRFLVLAKKYGKPTGHDKTSILFSVKHKVGALYSALEGFKKGQLNLTKIESRPSKTKAWEYYFFVDFEGHADDKKTKQALQELEEHCTLLTVLGSYPNAMGREH